MREKLAVPARPQESQECAVCHCFTQEGYTLRDRQTVRFVCAECYENEENMSLQRYLDSFSGHCPQTLSFFVGPEGGYAEHEIAEARTVGVTSVKFGERILRCETASGFVLSCLAYVFEKPI